MHISSALPLLTSIALTACAGSSATLAMQPDFEVITSTGPASVSIRGAPPDMTYAQFEHVVKADMELAMPANTRANTVAGPFPERRIVWHVLPMPPHGTLRLVVNIFNGSVPFAYEQQVIDGSAPTSDVAYAVEVLTGRVVSVLDRRDQESLG